MEDRGTKLDLSPLNQMGMGITMSKRESGMGSPKTREGEAIGISAEKQGFRNEEEQIQAQRQREVSPLPSMALSLAGSCTGGKAIIPSSLSAVQKVCQGCYQSHPGQDSNHDANDSPF